MTYFGNYLDLRVFKYKKDITINLLQFLCPGRYRSASDIQHRFRCITCIYYSHCCYRSWALPWQWPLGICITKKDSQQQFAVSHMRYPSACFPETHSSIVSCFWFFSVLSLLPFLEEEGVHLPTTDREAPGCCCRAASLLLPEKITAIKCSKGKTKLWMKTGAHTRRGHKLWL